MQKNCVYNILFVVYDIMWKAFKLNGKIFGQRIYKTENNNKRNERI